MDQMPVVWAPGELRLAYSPARTTLDPKPCEHLSLQSLSYVLCIENGKGPGALAERREDRGTGGSDIWCLTEVLRCKWSTAKLSRKEDPGHGHRGVEGHAPGTATWSWPTRPWTWASIQHNRNVPQGRDGFKQFMSRVPGRTPRDIKTEMGERSPVTLIDYLYNSVMMWHRTVKYLDDPGSARHRWNDFDVARIQDQIKQDGTRLRTNPPAQAPAR